MNIDPGLLGRLLRQWRELGDRELYLESMSAAEALALVSPEKQQAPERAPRSEAASSPAAAPQGPLDRSVRGLVPAPQGLPDPPAELRVLRQEAQGCTRCRLHESRRTVVFGEGNPQADLVVVGEAPGADEDRTGRPFVGQAGKLLDLMLMAIGLSRSDVYICNVLKCRPPKNRNPQADEVASCSDYLHGQLDHIRPRVLLAVGKFAAQMLAGSDKSIGGLRGQVHSYRGVPLVASYHPAYLLRSPNMTPTAWQDLQLLRQILDEQR